MGTFSMGMLFLIIVNLIMTFFGLRTGRFFNLFSLRMEDLVIRKDYKRILTSGFLHFTWGHFIFNMTALLCFSPIIKIYTGEAAFMIIYFSSLVSANCLAIFFQKKFLSYSMVGASGAVSGIVLASLILSPEFTILSIPAWAFGFLYIVYIIYGIVKQLDYIGHEAYFGGGLTGLLVAVIYKPFSLSIEYLPIFLITTIAIVFLGLRVFKMRFAKETNAKKKPLYKKDTSEDHLAKNQSKAAANSSQDKDTSDRY